MFRKQSTELCGSCKAVCCRDTIIPLDLLEAERLSKSGTQLLSVNQEAIGVAPPHGRDFYRMVGSCANLDPVTNKCGDYENRPAACHEFKAGDLACIGARIERLNGGPVPIGMPAFPESATPAGA
jgi:Fe-S-cluster containining protein